MGYYTRYKLEEPVVDKELGWEIAEAMEKYESGYGPLSDFIGGFGESIKWYEHESCMRGFSRNFPDVVFTLHGEGEESGDLWVKYFKDGKMQRVDAVISYAGFDEGQLK